MSLCERLTESVAPQVRRSRARRELRRLRVQQVVALKEVLLRESLRACVCASACNSAWWGVQAERRRAAEVVDLTAQLASLQRRFDNATARLRAEIAEKAKLSQLNHQLQVRCVNANGLLSAVCLSVTATALVPPPDGPVLRQHVGGGAPGTATSDSGRVGRA